MTNSNTSDPFLHLSLLEDAILQILSPGFSSEGLSVSHYMIISLHRLEDGRLVLSTYDQKGVQISEELFLGGWKSDRAAVRKFLDLVTEARTR